MCNLPSHGIILTTRQIRMICLAIAAKGERHHQDNQCACGHLLRSDRERAEMRCIECRVTLLMSDLPCLL